MKRRAFSYLRFSTPGQAFGDSSRRQRALADAYAHDKGLVLDETLSFSDLGVSAYRSKNSKVGALKAFLDAVELNLIERGSYLLVESLDRLSRDQILAAQAIFLQIISAGITLVTLMDRREYSTKSINDNPFELIISLVTMIRANEESAVKSRRLTEYWSKKREQFDGKPTGGVCPGWLQLNKLERKFELKEPQVKVVRWIFQEYLNGKGRHTIARELNESGAAYISTRKQARFWQSMTIGRLLRSPAVIGTMMPTTGITTNGRYKRIGLPPIKNYYPAIIDSKTFEAVQSTMQERRDRYSRRVSKGPAVNILAGLARCPDCGSSMGLTARKGRNRQHRYLVCSRAKSGAGCIPRYVRYEEIADAIICRMEELLERREYMMNIPDEDLHHTKDFIEARRGSVSRKRKTSRSLFQSRLEELRLQALRRNPDLTKINAALQRCFISLILDYKGHRLILRWRDGAVGFFPSVWPSSYIPDNFRLRNLSPTGIPVIDPATRLKDYGYLLTRGGGRYPSLTLDQVQKARRLRSEGSTIVAIAELLNVSTTTIYRRLIETRSDYLKPRPTE